MCCQPPPSLVLQRRLPTAHGCALFHVVRFTCSQIIDPIGFDDANPRRLVLLRDLEERLQNVLMLMERNLGTMGPTQEHLLGSPFMAKWFRAHMDPDPGARLPALSFMLYRCVRPYECGLCVWMLQTA